MAAARALGRSGGRPYKMTAAKLRLRWRWASRRRWWGSWARGWESVVRRCTVMSGRSLRTDGRTLLGTKGGRAWLPIAGGPMPRRGRWSLTTGPCSVRCGGVLMKRGSGAALAVLTLVALAQGGGALSQGVAPEADVARSTTSPI